MVADPQRFEQMVAQPGEQRAQVRPGAVHPAGADRRRPGVRLASTWPTAARAFPSRSATQLFDEYTRAEGNTAEGVGLGLYVVQVLAQAQGGSVDYADAPTAARCSPSRLPATPE